MVLAGSQVAVEPTPWMLALEVGTGHCGAVLIGPQTALTAAHCVTDVPAEELAKDAEREARHCAREMQTQPSAVPTFAVRAGSKERTGGERIEVARLSVHPDWRWRGAGPEVLAGDVAVLALERPVTGATPIRLARTPLHPGEAVVAYGWGAQDPQGCDGPARILRQHRLVVVGGRDCAISPLAIGDVCTQTVGQVAGVKRGASGGPVVRWTGRQAELAAIITDYCLGCPFNAHADAQVYGEAITNMAYQLTQR
ncbi:MAG TPA: trypsin-like serine protease [Pedococcus sp.]|nr:trypsin-like serine protease [Pedococcus sp.]